MLDIWAILLTCNTKLNTKANMDGMSFLLPGLGYQVVIYVFKLIWN